MFVSKYLFASIAMAAICAGAVLAEPANQPQAPSNGNQHVPPPYGGMASNYDFGSALFVDRSSRCNSLSASAHVPKTEPQVIDTFPMPGAVVRPGLIVVRVTFDRPMACDASFGSKIPGNPCPSRWTQPDVSADRRSFRVLCEVRPSQGYVLPLRSFRSARLILMKPLDIRFSTSSNMRVKDVREALAQDADPKRVVGG